jgi:hypothetical protein
MDRQQVADPLQSKRWLANIGEDALFFIKKVDVTIDSTFMCNSGEKRSVTRVMLEYLGKARIVHLKLRIDERGWTSTQKNNFQNIVPFTTLGKYRNISSANLKIEFMQPWPEADQWLRDNMTQIHVPTQSCLPIIPQEPVTANTILKWPQWKRDVYANACHPKSGERLDKVHHHIMGTWSARDRTRYERSVEPQRTRLNKKGEAEMINEQMTEVHRWANN